MWLLSGCCECWSEGAACRAFAVAALLCALVARVALALEGALSVDALAICTQPHVLTLVNICQKHVVKVFTLGTSVKVQTQEEEKKSKSKGWKSKDAPITGIKYWYWHWGERFSHKICAVTMTPIPQHQYHLCVHVQYITYFCQILCGKIKKSKYTASITCNGIIKNSVLGSACTEIQVLEKKKK